MHLALANHFRQNCAVSKGLQHVRFVSFNVNGIRARQHQLAAVTAEHSPDLLALQETKVVDGDFPLAALEDLGYPHVAYYGQKGHYGVAIASRAPLEQVQLGIPWRPEDQQRRFISAEVVFGEQRLHIVNGYFPQGEKREHPTKFPNKAEFYADVLRYCEEHLDPSQPVIIAGDMNVAPADSDIGIGEDNKKRWLRSGKASFLPEEREWLERLMVWGLKDAFQQAEDEQSRLYSWFDYRSRGFEREPRRGLRIDLILASNGLAEALTESGIDYGIRGSEKPSDHCPIWAEFRL
jgi:exodeoxyribonuclease-3